jgi:hypothetical protein
LFTRNAYTARLRSTLLRLGNIVNLHAGVSFTLDVTEWFFTDYSGEWTASD